MAGDNFFGPHQPGFFDFTILFEQSILSILPTALFVLVAPWQISKISRREVCVLSGPLLWAKLVSLPVD